MGICRKFESLNEFMTWAFSYLIAAHTINELRTRYERSVDILARLWAKENCGFDLSAAKSAVRVLNETYNLRKELFKND